MTMATESGRIKHGGMGEFLTPPTHPEHSFSVETELRRKPENRGSMSLSYAVKSLSISARRFELKPNRY